jgi:hypothetical protein
MCLDWLIKFRELAPSHLRSVLDLMLLILRILDGIEGNNCVRLGIPEERNGWSVAS